MMFGGNHRRARREAFSAARQASLATIDESTEAHDEALMPRLSQSVAEFVQRHCTLIRRFIVF
jgi:hypothetical protein